MIPSLIPRPITLNTIKIINWVCLDWSALPTNTYFMLARQLKITDTVKIGGKTFKVTAIGDNAFKGYKKLKTITIESKNIKSVGQAAVKNIHKKATITVPKNKVKEYKKLFNKNTGFTSKMTIKKA